MTSTEPYSPWQNRMERVIQDSKKLHRRIMHWNKVPEKLWDFCLIHCADFYSSTIHLGQGEETGYTMMLGDTPDITHLIYFDYYRFVSTLEQHVQFPE
jgi:hypothetical protein